MLKSSYWKRGGDPREGRRHDQWVNKDVIGTYGYCRREMRCRYSPAQSASTVVTKAGAIEYYCRFHPNMRGRLQAEKPLAYYLPGGLPAIRRQNKSWPAQLSRYRRTGVSGRILLEIIDLPSPRLQRSAPSSGELLRYQQTAVKPNFFAFRWRQFVLRVPGK